MNHPLRIAVTVDPELPVPPRHQGGIERIVFLLVDELTARGHDVTLFANPESKVPCRLVPYAGSHSESKLDALRNMRLIAATLRRRPVDLVHSFGRIAYMLPLLPTALPKVMSYQRWITARSVRLASALSRGSLQFTGCSHNQIERVRAWGTWHVIYNGVPIDRYEFRAHVEPDAPLMFLGRIEHLKGTHVAVEVARRTGRRLIVAGSVASEHEEYFRTQVQPFVDGHAIVYVGPVNDEQKNELLGKAAALLMPVLLDEPFGIVMAEALACGTPVLGFHRGSVPEVVKHGTTGFVCKTTDDMVAAVERIPTLDRAKCRDEAVARFSQAAIVDDYEALYRSFVPSESTCGVAVGVE